MKTILICFVSLLMVCRGYCEENKAASLSMESIFEMLDYSAYAIRDPEDGSSICAPEYRDFPVLISLKDKNGTPIHGAIVVLKRLGPDGWTEEELKREKNSITDKNGNIVVMYPSYAATRDKSGQQCVPIYGAVTVIAEGHRIVTIELRDHFQDGICILSSDSAPHLWLSLKDGLPSEDGMKRDAEQPADGKTPEASQAPR